MRVAFVQQGVERGKNDGEKAPREENRLLARPNLGGFEGQEIRAEGVEQAKGARKQDKADRSGDEGDENDISRKARPHLHHGIVSVQLLYLYLDVVRFALHLLALREAGGEGRTRLKLFFEADHPVEDRLEESHRLSGLGAAPHRLVDVDPDLLNDGRRMLRALLVQVFTFHNDASRHCGSLMVVEQGIRFLEKSAHLSMG